MKKGSIIFQLPKEKINQIINFNNQVDKIGLGKSGEAFLVGTDLTMCDDSRFLERIQELDTATQKAKTTIGNYKIDTLAVKDALDGNSKTSLGIDYLGNPVILSYAPIKVYNEKWAMIVKIDENEALANANEFIEKVRVTVSEATSTSNSNTQIATTLSRASVNMKAQAQEESRIVHEVSRDGQELQNILSVSTEQAKQTKETKENIDNTGNTLKNVLEVIASMINKVSSIEKISDASSNLMQMTNNLNDLLQGYKTQINIF